jgi:hypothetical protein
VGSAPNPFFHTPENWTSSNLIFDGFSKSSEMTGPVKYVIAVYSVLF